MMVNIITIVKIKQVMISRLGSTILCSIKRNETYHMVVHIVAPDQKDFCNPQTNIVYVKIYTIEKLDSHDGNIIKREF